MNILEEIIAYKKIEVDKAKNVISLDEIKKRASSKHRDKRSFFESLEKKAIKKEIGLIAEVKKASPSKGIIRADFNPVEIAMAYESGGATCLSVLTDKKYFQGDEKYIEQIKNKVSLPVLRKDFIVDPYQIYESVTLNADCILLIVAAFSDKILINQLYETAIENELDVLVEVHDEKEMEVALGVISTLKPKALLGINNRSLKTFETKLDTTKDLVNKYKRDLLDKIVVSESGIFTNNDIKDLIKSDVFCFLVGESLMRERDIEAATKLLMI